MSLQRGSVREGRGSLQPLPLRARSGHILQRSARIENAEFSVGKNLIFVY